MSDRAARRAVLICGMHRSGTSLLANMLRDAGIMFGDDLLDEAQPDNADGYGEHAGIVAVHETLLKALGRDWHGSEGMLTLPCGWLDRPETFVAQVALEAIVAREFAGAPLWATKDPRTSRLLPLWRRMLRGLGIEITLILCVRDPDAVAGSLATRNRMPCERAHAIWTAHNRDVLADRARDDAGPFAIVDYDAMLVDPHATLRNALDEAALELPEAAVARALTRVKPQLRHHRAARGASDTSEREAARNLYQRIRDVPPTIPDSAPTPDTVTIVVRTRDRPVFLARAFASILNQSHEAWYVVLVNDGGDRGAVEAIVAGYDSAFAGRISIVHLSGGGGMEAASNAGIASRGDTLVAIHDDDDSWHPRFLERCVARLARSGAGAVVTQSLVIDEHVEGDRIVEDRRTPFLTLPGRISERDLRRYNLFPPIACVYRRALYCAVGPYRADLPVLGDWDFNFRMARLDRIEVIGEPLACRHRRPAGGAFPNSDLDLHGKVEARLRSDLGLKPRPVFRPALALATHATKLQHAVRGTIAHCRQMSDTAGQDRLPDFLCIGAQRSGTTLLHAALRGHPGLFLPPCKELHALDAMAGIEPARWQAMRLDFLAATTAAASGFGRGRGAALRQLGWARRFALPDTVDLDWYATLFREARADQCAGEITPAYSLLSEKAIAALVARQPDLRVFFLMRDPVERALSGAIHACTTGRGQTGQPDMADLRAALADPGCIARSRYRATIERWTTQLAPGHFHALSFDALKTDPAPVLDTVHHALGVARRRPTIRSETRVNANSVLVEWPRAALQEIAEQLRDDCAWLADNYGEEAIGWAERARRLAAGHDARP